MNPTAKMPAQRANKLIITKDYLKAGLELRSTALPFDEKKSLGANQLVVPKLLM